jgi:glutathione S-transferase
MAPVKLYGPTLSWNVMRCVAALEEAAVKYEIVPINLGTGEHKSPDHLARNVSSPSLKCISRLY